MVQVFVFLESLAVSFWIFFVLFFPGVRYRWLPIVIVLSQFLPMYWPWLIPAHIDALFRVLLITIFYYVNLRIHVAGFSVLLIGTLSNVLVLIANGARMPATLKELGIYQQYYEHTVQMSEDTRLNFLGDWISIDGKLLSPGDVIITLGWLIIAIFCVFKILNSIRSKLARR